MTTMRSRNKRKQLESNYLIRVNVFMGNWISHLFIIAYKWEFRKPRRCLWRPKHNRVVGSRRTCKCASLIISVTISVWTPILEKPGEICRPTFSRQAAVFIRLEYCARVVTAARGSKFIRALPVYIGSAADAAGASTRSQAEFHWHIEPVYERYVKDVQVAELV